MGATVGGIVGTILLIGTFLIVPLFIWFVIRPIMRKYDGWKRENWIHVEMSERDADQRAAQRILRRQRE